MKKQVYLDSTIFSYLFDNRNDIRNFIDITQQWWREEKGYFDLWISEETLFELNKGNYPNQDKILSCALEITLLPVADEIKQIAQIYLDNYLMPRVLLGDAIHLAYASYYKMDFLLTWNCNHLANANKQKHIRTINTRLNLSIPEIITPLQLFTET